MLQYDNSAFYFFALSFITIYLVPCKCASCDRKTELSVGVSFPQRGDALVPSPFSLFLCFGFQLNLCYSMDIHLQKIQ